MNYQYKTVPFEHQKEAFDLSCDKEFFALLMEQGTGKTKVTIDTAAYLWSQGRIDALLVIAPNGVHRNWIRNEIPIHLPDYVEYKAAWWVSSPKKAEREALDALWESGHQMRVLCMNVEAFTTAKGKDYARKFLNSFKVMMVVDESSRIKTPGAQRTKTITALGKHAAYRRILTGTPVTQSPFDIYAQFKFLDDNILGTTSYYAFKARYAEFLDSSNRLVQDIARRTGRIPQIVATDRNGKPVYKNLDELHQLIKGNSFRVLKSECLDLPEKLYQRRYVELNTEQKRIYESFKKNLIAVCGEDVMEITHKLTLLLRLQQVVCGYFPLDDGFKEIPGGNPRLDALLEVVEETTGKIIIWSRFVADIERITLELNKIYGDGSAVSYYGKMDGDERMFALESFQSGDARFFIGQPHSGGIGLTLTAATTVVYYSNDFSLETRLQSEDRAHRIGQTKNVTYIDIEAVDTMDSAVINALRSKKNIADLITGDPKEWL